MYKSEVELLMAEGLTDKAALSQVNGVFELASTEIALRNFGACGDWPFKNSLWGTESRQRRAFPIMRFTVNSGHFTK